MALTGPNQPLQQTGHATDGLSSFRASSRVRRLLSVVVRVRHEGVAETVLLFERR